MPTCSTDVVVSQSAVEGDVLADEEVVARLVGALEALVAAEEQRAA